MPAAPRKPTTQVTQRFGPQNYFNYQPPQDTHIALMFAIAILVTATAQGLLHGLPKLRTWYRQRQHKSAHLSPTAPPQPQHNTTPPPEIIEIPPQVHSSATRAVPTMDSILQQQTASQSYAPQPMQTIAHHPHTHAPSATNDYPSPCSQGRLHPRQDSTTLLDKQIPGLPRHYTCPYQQRGHALHQNRPIPPVHA